MPHFIGFSCKVELENGIWIWRQREVFCYLGPKSSFGYYFLKKFYSQIQVVNALIHARGHSHSAHTRGQQNGEQRGGSWASQSALRDRVAPVPGLFYTLSWISLPNPNAGSKREDSRLVSCFLDNFWWNMDHLQSLTTFFSQKSKSLVLLVGERDWRNPSNLEKQRTWKERWPHEPVTAKHSRQGGTLQTGQLSQGEGGCLVESWTIW